MKSPTDYPKDKVESILKVYNGIWEAYDFAAMNCESLDAKVWAELARTNTSVSQYAFLKKMGMPLEINRGGNTVNLQSLKSYIEGWKQAIHSLNIVQATKDNAIRVCDIMLTNIGKI
jgi:hypothetical protein